MVPLERFAQLRAAVERGGDRDAVLRAEGISPTEWIRLQRHWLDALAVEIAKGGDTLATRYWQAFQGAPSEAAAPAKPVTPQPEPRAPAPPPPPVAVVESPPPAPRVHDLRGTAAVFEIPRMPATPFREGAPAEPVAASSAGTSPGAAPASEARPSTAASRVSTGTAFAFEVPRGPATPFQSEPNPSPSPTPAAQPGSGTAWAPSAPSGPATPFQSLEPEALGFNLLRYAELVAARDEPGANLADVLAELGIDAAAHTQIEAYWRRKFSENGLLAMELGRHLAQAKKALADRRATRGAPVGSGTMLSMNSPAQPAPAASPAQPAPAASPAPQRSDPQPVATPDPPRALPELNVEQYAWLVATLRKTPPAALPAVLARVRLTLEACRELDALWVKRLEADPALMQAFNAALGRHLAGGGG